jgi:hypothetical protein
LAFHEAQKDMRQARLFQEQCHRMAAHTPSQLVPAVRKASNIDTISGRRPTNKCKVDSAYYDTMVGSERNE